MKGCCLPHVSETHRASVSVGEVRKILVLDRLNYPRPLYKVEDWADRVSTIDLFGIPPCLLNDDGLGRCSASSSYATSWVSPDLVIWDSTSLYFEGTHDDSGLVVFGYAVEGIQRRTIPSPSSSELGFAQAKSLSGSENAPFT